MLSQVVAAAAATNPSDGREDERARQQGGAAEVEGGGVTSCDVNQPTCREEEFRCDITTGRRQRIRNNI